MKHGNPLNAREKRIAGVLAAIFFLRMLGLFMLMPVLATYTASLADATPLLIGLALGVYGLTQASCQIPLGQLSDRIGRRPVIVGGLLIFVVGAVCAAWASSIWPILVGRAIQGLGAVSGASLALAADESRAEQRTKMMALLGISIGLAFSFAFIVGPLVNAWFGLRGLFLSTALLGLLALALAWLKLPSAKADSTSRGPVPKIAETLRSPELRVLYVGVGALHLVLAASFVVLPLALLDGMGIEAARHYVIYLPVLLLSLLLTGPLVMLSSRRGLAAQLFLAAICALAVSELGFALCWQSDYLPLALVVFFVAFNFIEAALPGIISAAAPASAKGTALGAYATFQFLGMFIGGALGGALASAAGPRSVPLAAAVLCAAWFALNRHLPTRLGGDTEKPDVID